MGYEISPENERYIQQVIERGEFDRPSSVLNAALHLMQERERSLAALREQIQEGIDSGPGVPADEAFARLDRKVDNLIRRSRGSE